MGEGGAGGNESLDSGHASAIRGSLPSVHGMGSGLAAAQIHFTAVDLTPRNPDVMLRWRRYNLPTGDFDRFNAEVRK